MCEQDCDDDVDVLLRYEVYKWSSYSANYLPENIVRNEPSKQSSRWSSSSNTPPQFLLLKLQKPAIVRRILFGKYEKNHVCNVKKFEIYGGMEENALVELTKGGLKNDHNPETFHLKYTRDGKPFPCRFIKIVPLLSWGSTFNFSIWYVELKGIEKRLIIQACLKSYYEQQEREAVRLCLKHFRQQNYTEAFAALQKKTKITLEHPLMTELHNKLVVEGDYEECEVIMEKAIADDLFNDYISRECITQWLNISQDSGHQSDSVPGMRGGHQMCMDYVNNHIYLLGGWDGTKDLSDFWRYEVDRSMWVCLSRDTENDGGPSARSCHKICIDCENGHLYTLGRYLDSSKRNPAAVKNDFHVFHINERQWEVISRDTSSENGPKLIFDHQMCIDQPSQTIYVFGGRILTANIPVTAGCIRPVPEFSGLFRYHIPTNKWHLLREDSGNAGPQDVRSRIGHSMLLDTKNHVLYIFGGQRSKEYVSDFFTYDIEQNSVSVLHDGTKKEAGLPPSGFTQRATIHPELGKIYMLTGLSKDKDKREDNMHNSFWIYSISDDTWTCVYRNESAAEITSFSQPGPSKMKIMAELGPCPRYAHQLVYDPIRQVHYMFGGNPGSKLSPKVRLSDFWRLKLISRVSRDDMLKKFKYMIRTYKYKELAVRDPFAAMLYLQNEVSETVVHSNPIEERNFRLLAVSLFGEISDSESDGETAYGSSACDHVKCAKRLSCIISKSSYQRLKYSNVDKIHILRTKLFDAVTAYFPDVMTQPSGSITDIMHV